MIIRESHVVVQPGAHADYEQWLRERIIPRMRTEPGLMYLHVGTPLPATPDEYVTVSVWDDIDAIKDYAGADWNQPNLMPAEKLLVRSITVRHFDALPIT
jgi:heme-degrading monooxygenase HmoA